MLVCFAAVVAIVDVVVAVVATADFTVVDLAVAVAVTVVDAMLMLC